MASTQKRLDIILSSNKTTEQKLQNICQFLHDEYEHFNWVGFYFKNGEKDELILGPYVGAATDHTIIPYGKGVCGQVAVSNETLVIDDVQQESNYLACSVDTQAEIVVPIFKNNQNIGQIDIDSHTKASITKDDKNLLEELMTKVAEIL